MSRFAPVLLALLVFCVPAGFAQKKSKGDQNTRTVQGVVTAADDTAVAGAIVQLEDTKTKTVRSFITQEKGAYYFHGLSPDIDYELRANHQGASSGTKTLSSFDSRKEAIINLKLNPKK
ncbi:MAG: carboxypeptidase-like regulatory domain-containing protein [Acidobacteriia bacterium]|nr:carboxypeptidase-like regulatory domain-containing protein [Terriglobia bacterium]